MKTIIYNIFFTLIPCLAWTQYLSNDNQKIKLGEQTTADGLIWRGVAATDTVRKPSIDTMAYMVLDTTTNIIWHYKKATSNAWLRLNLLPSDTASFNYVNTYGTQTVNGAKTISGVTIFSNTTEAGNAASAPVTFLGGVGIAKNLRVGGSIVADGPDKSIATLNGGDMQFYNTGNNQFGRILSTAGSGGNIRFQANGSTNVLDLGSTGLVTIFNLAGGTSNRPVLADVNGSLSAPSTPLPVANGGTGSATQNFVDLTTTQSSIGGKKTFTSGIATTANINGDPEGFMLTNISTGLLAESTLYVRNESNINAGIFFQTTGTNFTPIGGFLADQGTIGTGTLLSNGMAFIVRAAADMRFYTSGHTNERMRITSGGNVGIGTASPQSLLQISNSANFSAVLKVSDLSTESTGAIVLGDGGSTLKNVGIWRAAANSMTTYGNSLNLGSYSDMVFTTGAAALGSQAERMRITSTGNVGIGLNTSGPFRLLDIESRGENDAFRIGPYEGTNFGIHQYYSTSGSIYFDQRFNNDVGNIYFRTKTTGTPINAFTILGSGNVGIGTASPGTNKLHIYNGSSGGVAYNSGGLVVESSGRASIQLLAPNNQDSYLFFGDANSGTGGYIGHQGTSQTPADLMVYYSEGNHSFTSGKVGIGRTPTTNALEVNGDASKTTAGSWLANSDSTIKTEIHTIDGALDRINKVRLVSFKYKDEYKLLNPSIKDKFYQNVIAQEYQEIYPDYVYQSGDIFEDKNILQVDTNPMYIDAVASIQELSKLVKELSAEINILKQEIINLKNK